MWGDEGGRGYYEDVPYLGDRLDNGVRVGLYAVSQLLHTWELFITLCLKLVTILPHIVHDSHALHQ